MARFYFLIGYLSIVITFAAWLVIGFLNNMPKTVYLLNNLTP